MIYRNNNFFCCIKGSRASETGSEISQSQSTSSLDRDDDERMKHVSYLTI